MGITVHFEGRLKDNEAYSGLIGCINKIGAADALLTETFENERVELSRVRDEKPWDYLGPSKGIVLYLDDDCDPLRLEFDQDLYIQEFVKTQFAGVRVHVKLVKILRVLEDYFDTLEVNDEGEYWETNDEAGLSEHIRRCNEVIAEFAAKNPRAEIKVKAPDGRLIDMIE